MIADTFKEKVVVVTGGANGIGRCIADEFRKQGAVVYVIDKQEGEHFVGDIAKQEVLEAFVSEVLSKHNKVDVIINNTLPRRLWLETGKLNRCESWTLKN